MSDPTDFKDIREFFTAVLEHDCGEARDIASREHQGTKTYNSWLGFECKGCGSWFRYQLHAAKAMQKPMMHYLQTTAQRVEVAKKANEDPKALLLEMRNSGGWAQPDPGVAMMHAMAACMVGAGKAEVIHGEGPRAALEKMMEGDPKPS